MVRGDGANLVPKVFFGLLGEGKGQTPPSRQCPKLGLYTCFL